MNRKEAQALMDKIKDPGTEEIVADVSWEGKILDEAHFITADKERIETSDVREAELVLIGFYDVDT